MPFLEINFHVNNILISIGVITFFYLWWALKDKMTDKTFYSLIVVVVSLSFGLISDFYYGTNEDVGIFGERREDQVSQEEVNQIGQELRINAEKNIIEFDQFVEMMKVCSKYAHTKFM